MCITCAGWRSSPAPADWFSSRERRQGYEQALGEIGQEPLVVYMPDTTVNMGYRAMLEALDSHPDLEGVVAVNICHCRWRDPRL